MTMTKTRKIINDPVFGFLSIPDGVLFQILQHPYMQRLIRKIKGDRIILITDATAYDAINPAGYEHITDLNFTPMPDGGVDVSGSKLYLYQAIPAYDRQRERAGRLS